MQDLLHIESEFTDMERLVRDNVRRFVDQEFMPLVNDAYEKGEFPRKLIPKLAELGILGATLPEKFGGSEVSYIAYGLICQELERGDSGLRSFVSVQSSLCMFPIFKFGSEAQKNKYLPPMSRGEIIGCFGLTEANAGSNPAQMKTFAKKVEGGWILNGSKLWITNATIADIAVVWAKTEDGIRGFIVEKDFKGFSCNKIHHKMSMRASDTGELIFTDCFIPDENILPGTEKGLVAALSCLTQARYGIAWGAIGAAMACFDLTLNYLKERQQFGKPLAAFQLVQKDLADMFAEITKAQLLNLNLGRLADKKLLNPVAVSLAKMNGAREALNIARNCRNLLGANGISLEYHVIRHLENLETVFTYEGTDNVHHLVIGKYLTDIDAFK